MTPTSPVNTTFCGALYQSSASSVDWLGKQAKTLSASAGETLGRVCSSVSAFFTFISATIGQWMCAAKEGLLVAKDQIMALPRETKIVGTIGLVAVAVASWVASSAWYYKDPAAVAVASAVPAAALAAAAVVNAADADAAKAKADVDAAAAAKVKAEAEAAKVKAEADALPGIPGGLDTQPESK